MAFDYERYEYILKLIDDSGKQLKPADGKKVTYSLGLMDGAGFKGPLGRFMSSGMENGVSILSDDALLINVKNFKDLESLKKLASAYPNAIFYEEGFSFVRITIDNNSSIKYDHFSGTLQVDSFVDGANITCTIDPLGVYTKVDTLEGEASFDGRMKIEDFLALNAQETQNAIINAEFSPSFVENMFSKSNNVISSPIGRGGKVSFRQIPMPLVDLYFKNISQSQTRIQDYNGAFHLPPIGIFSEEPAAMSEYSITAIPNAYDETGKPSSFIYLAKRNDGKGSMAVYDSSKGKFHPFSTFNFVKDNEGKVMVSFISKNKQDRVYAEIPLAEGSNELRDGNFLNAIASFVEFNPQTELPYTMVTSPSKRHAQNPPSASDETIKLDRPLFSSNEIVVNRTEDSGARTVITDHLKSTSVRKKIENEGFTPSSQPKDTSYANWYTDYHFDEYEPNFSETDDISLFEENPDLSNTVDTGVNPFDESSNPTGNPVPPIPPVSNITPPAGNSTFTPPQNPNPPPQNPNTPPQNPIVQPPSPIVLPQTHLVAPGNMTNPYVAPPIKEVAKKPIKINENWVKYGGAFLGILLVAMGVLVFGPLVGGIVATLGIGVMAAAPLIIMRAQHLQNNPYKEYTNGLIKAEQEAEQTAAKFWENSVEYGKDLDKYNQIYSQLTDPQSFAPGGELEFFSHLKNSGLVDDQWISDFLERGNIDNRNRFTSDLMAIREMQDKFASGDASVTQDLIDKAQKRFMDDFELNLPITSNTNFTATNTTNDLRRKAFFNRTQSANMGKMINAVDKLSSAEKEMTKSHVEVGQILRECSHSEFMKIINQPGVDKDAFAAEYALDIADRMQTKSGLTDQMRTEVFKALPALIDNFDQTNSEIDEAYRIIKDLAIMENGRDYQFESIDKALQSIEKFCNRDFEDSLITKNNFNGKVRNFLLSIENDDIARDLKVYNDRKNTNALSNDISELSNIFILAADKPQLQRSLANLDQAISDSVDSSSFKTDYENMHNALFSNCLNKISDMALDSGVVNPLFNSRSYSTIVGERSVQKIVQTFVSLNQNNQEAKDLDLACQAYNNRRTQITADVIANELKKLSLSANLSLTEIQSIGKDVLDKKIDELKSHDFFKELDDTQKESIARTYLAVESKLSTQLSSATTDKEKQSISKANDQVKTHMHSICSGFYTEKKLASREKDLLNGYFNDIHQHDKTVKIENRDKARQPINEMLSKLYESGISHEEISNIYQIASDNQKDDSKPLNPRQIIKAILSKHADDAYQDMSKRGIIRQKTLKDICQIDVDNSSLEEVLKSVKKLRKDFANLKSTAQDATKREVLQRTGYIVGEKQAESCFEHDKKDNIYNTTQNGNTQNNQNGSTQPVKIDKASKAAIAANKAQKEFDKKVAEFVEKLYGDNSIKLFTNLDSSVSDNTRKQAFEDLRKDLSKALDKKTMKDLFKDANIAGIKSWNDIYKEIADKNIDPNKLQQIRESIYKALRAKQKKLGKKLDDKKKRATKDKVSRKARFVGEKTRKKNVEKANAAITRVKDDKQAKDDLINKNVQISQAQEQEENKYGVSHKNTPNLEQH